MELLMPEDAGMEKLKSKGVMNITG